MPPFLVWEEREHTMMILTSLLVSLVVLYFFAFGLFSRRKMPSSTRAAKSELAELVGQTETLRTKIAHRAGTMNPNSSR
jgi:hypothetical protein